MVLLVFGIHLTRPRETTSALSELNSTGVLQLALLLGCEPLAAKQMARNVTHRNPDVLHLLEARKSITLDPQDSLRKRAGLQNSVVRAEADVRSVDTRTQDQETVQPA